MKAIVVLFFRTREPETSVQQLTLRPTRRPAPPANPSGDTPKPPFWTWFIENPRLVQSNDIAV
jgi:hypothetical protein